MELIDASKNNKYRDVAVYPTRIYLSYMLNYS